MKVRGRPRRVWVPASASMRLTVCRDTLASAAISEVDAPAVYARTMSSAELDFIAAVRAGRLGGHTVEASRALSIGAVSATGGHHVIGSWMPLAMRRMKLSVLVAVWWNTVVGPDTGYKAGPEHQA